MPTDPTKPDRPPGRDYRDEPTFWFASLEVARERGDFERAAEAKRQLRRLGVIVHFERPAAKEGGAR